MLIIIVVPEQMLIKVKQKYYIPRTNHANMWEKILYTNKNIISVIECYVYFYKT
jgi:hypothetical protein